MGVYLEIMEPTSGITLGIEPIQKADPGAFHCDLCGPERKLTDIQALSMYTHVGVY